MPLYEYQCLPHGHRLEVRHGITEEPDIKCPQCGGAMRRVIHPVGIVFKGSGFYATDSRRSGTSKSDSGTKTESTTTTEGKSETTKAETSSSGSDKTPSGKTD